VTERESTLAEPVAPTYITDSAPGRDEARSEELIPFQRPAPARLSELSDELAAIEASRIFSNFGPVNTLFEQAITTEMFGGGGHCVTMCNATIGLLLALRQAIEGMPSSRRYALMPSFTFAATAHSALAVGLIPLLSDIDPETWLACPDSEARLLHRYGEQVAVIVGCTTFGNPIDLARYRALASTWGAALVVDAAAALGTTDLDGRQFGCGAPEPIVFSMHVTKPFATLEGSVIYANDPGRIAGLRAMANFGFETPRSASLPGLNAKLSEVNALMALTKLEAFQAVVDNRYARDCEYRALLPEFGWQRMRSPRNAPTFGAALAPKALAHRRDDIRQAMLRDGVQTGAYFDPHLARQPYFADRCEADDLPVCDDVARRMISLPMFDTLSAAQVERVARVLRSAVR
jgi:dTDP-4-amino-4,6-dideoxygalactose transaminase